MVYITGIVLLYGLPRVKMWSCPNCCSYVKTLDFGNMLAMIHRSYLNITLIHYSRADSCSDVEWAEWVLIIRDGLSSFDFFTWSSTVQPVCEKEFGLQTNGCPIRPVSNHGLTTEGHLVSFRFESIILCQRKKYIIISVNIVRRPQKKGDSLF